MTWPRRPTRVTGGWSTVACGAARGCGSTGGGRGWGRCACGSGCAGPAGPGSGRRCSRSPARPRGGAGEPVVGAGPRAPGDREPVALGQGRGAGRGCVPGAGGWRPADPLGVAQRRPAAAAGQRPGPDRLGGLS
jgi:hypothetical protein